MKAKSLLKEMQEQVQFNHLSVLGGISRAGFLGNLGHTGWTEIKVTVDSGACDTVMPLSMCAHIPHLPSEMSKNGGVYEVANKETIPNVGERRCVVMTSNGGGEKRITFQIADVHKPLLSISKLADQGFACVLTRDGGWLEHIETGERIPVQREGSLYTLNMWIKDDQDPGQGFGRQE